MLPAPPQVPAANASVLPDVNGASCFKSFPGSQFPLMICGFYFYYYSNSGCFSDVVSIMIRLNSDLSLVL